MKVTKLLQVLLSVNVLVKAAPLGTDYMKLALDDMAEHFSSPHQAGAKFNQTFYDRLKTCLAKFGDDKLYATQNHSWKGLHDYWLSNGTMNDTRGRPDPWGDCVGEHDGDCRHAEWMEYREGRSAPFGGDKMLALGPCNYASNVAYYHTLVKVCDYPDWSEASVANGYVRHLKQAFATHASGSAFFHASLTHVGNEFDVDMIAVVAYLGHQMLVQGLKTNSSIIHEISLTPRNQSSFEVMEGIMASITNDPVPDWVNVLEHADYPRDYQGTFGAIVTTLVALGLPAFIAHPLNTFLVNSLLSGDAKDFSLNSYLPALEPLVAGVKGVHALDVLSRGVGVIIKLVFAFLYQEK